MSLATEYERSHHHDPNKHMKQSGLSLIEVMVALAILSVVLIAASSIIRQSTKRSIQLQQRTASAHCLQNQIAIFHSNRGDLQKNQGICEQDPALHWQADIKAWPQDPIWQQLSIWIDIGNTRIQHEQILMQKQRT